MESADLVDAIVKTQQKQFAHHAQSLQRAARTLWQCKSHTEFGGAYQKMIALQFLAKKSRQIFPTLHKTFLPPKKRKSPADKIRGAFLLTIFPLH
jgi:hypothetical protein